MKTILVLILVLSAAPLVAVDKTTEELNIREVVYRYQIQQFQKEDASWNAQVFCLEIVVKGKSSNPADDFMQRFQGDLPAVKKASGCSRESSGVRDKATEVHGVIVRTEAIKWVSDTEVQLDGGDHEAGNGGSGNTYYLRKIDGRWTVQKTVRHWVA